jgi:squalene-associated FAD-dependent desaturase
MTSALQRTKIGVIGGGLAGLSAACALAEAGFIVTLLERRPYLGGRASSYQHPGTEEIVDNCQHVLLGCCTNLIDLYRRLRVADKIQWFERLNFIEPGGRLSVIQASLLPAPFHNAPSFARAAFLDMGDKDAIARGLFFLAITPPGDDGEHFLSWLERHGQTDRAIERFWKPVLVSALNEDLERMAATYAEQVFRESFLKSRAAGRMGVPRVPLSELYGAAGDFLTSRSGKVLTRFAVERVEPGADKVVVAGNNQRLDFDYAVPAIPFDALLKMLPSGESAQPLRDQLARFETSPITGIHLWFDRQITLLPHAVLLDRTIQWMFHKSMLQNRQQGAAGGSYVELVVSSSKSLVETGRQDIIDLALRELAEFFPEARQAKLIKATVIKEIHATYSALPQSDAYRPRTATVWPRIFLAGDWTFTGWPATMEGAVRSGYAAAEAVAAAATGNPQKFLVPDLPASGLMRLAEYL